MDLKGEDFQEEVMDVISDLERDNAIRLLPEYERRVIQLVEKIDYSLALKSKNIREYLLLNNIATPVERAAKQLNKTPEEVKSILMSAQNQILSYLNDHKK